MSSTEFEARIKQAEGRLDKAESVLDSVGRVLSSIERAHETAARRNPAPLALFAVAAIVAVTLVFVERRQHSV